MIQIVDTTIDDVFALLAKRTIASDRATEEIVRSIIEDVRLRGDTALVENARKFDAPSLSSIQVTTEEFEETIGDEELAAIRVAIDRVRAFHERQRVELGFGNGSDRIDQQWSMSEQPDSLLGQRYRSLGRVGVYVPGGAAAYPSSVVMNAIPAIVAGVSDVVVTTPARSDGTLHPAVLVAMREVGIGRAVKIGGAAAIAALALGTESVPRVDKVVGPGNRFVNEAKRQLWGRVGLDGYAGPSEVCVFADDAASADLAAIDLLTQIEHAPDNAGFLVTLSRSKCDEVLAQAEKFLEGSKNEAVMRAALKNQSLAIVVRDTPEAIDVIDAIAPEHLSLAISEPEKVAAKVSHAGCILMGEWSPESGGDYCIGPSHTLPTSGAARWQSPVNVLDFLKVQSLIKTSREQVQQLIPTIETFGQMEGFPIHAKGATLRRR